jgi:hypothetical protein
MNIFTFDKSTKGAGQILPAVFSVVDYEFIWTLSLLFFLQMLRKRGGSAL